MDGLGAEEICRRAMRIAGDICVYTNSNIVIETLDSISDGPIRGSGQSPSPIGPQS